MKYLIVFGKPEGEKHSRTLLLERYPNEATEEVRKRRKEEEKKYGSSFEVVVLQGENEELIRDTHARYFLSWEGKSQKERLEFYINIGNKK